jgi:hypothetical protein
MSVAEIRRQRILQKDFKLVEFASRRWSAALQEGQVLEDAMAPEFWSNVARGDQRSLMAGDVVEVRAHDHSFFAELYVRKVDQGSALVALIRATDFVDHAAEAKAAKHDGVLAPRWNLGRKCFDVIRPSDKEIISTGHKLKEDAQAWIADHLKALKAA